MVSAPINVVPTPVVAESVWIRLAMSTTVVDAEHAVRANRVVVVVSAKAYSKTITTVASVGENATL